MEEELRELRLQLKAARSDVKRYASYALRLQQDLEREKQRREEDTNRDILDDEDACFPDIREKYTGPAAAALWDKKVEKARKEHVAWGRKIDRVVRTLEGRGEAVGGKRRDKNCDSNQVEESVDNVIQELVPFLKQQRSLIGELGRENAKLRDMLQARPTRRELLSSQMEVERLQQKLRVRARGAGATKSQSEVSVNDDVTGSEYSLSEKIIEERVLQALRVKTEKSVTRHKYLREKLHCYLSLDPALKTQNLTETNMLERVGRICSDIVASCCYVLEVEDVRELPHCVEKAHQLAHVSTTYQKFVERIEKLLKRFDEDAFYSIRAEFAAETSCHEALDMILSHVNDVLVELDARREQMKPPGSKAHEVLLTNMKLLQVPRIDQLAPTIRRLVDNMRTEQEFQGSLRELFGLDEAASRKQILHVASVLFGELGFLTDNATSPKDSRR
ncbi:hypothetical protein PR001_g15527 [Phytophthora rubi]|uniref:Centrosomal protein of 70 kDa n=1 Tax=Phytophthora rubi TaxID=129364 RepID=A0A6A3L1X1_9STRA|nr:hypothetical protein PR002_g15994 [Phytophthora rubi]KAE9012970.1 hypothetical protein PR001_g15527 [Phytophthora rubi]